MDDQLLQHLLQANQAYHNGAPIISDDQFDALVAKWESQTGRKWSDVAGVGAIPLSSSAYSITKLPMWMGSMNKVKQEKDILQWKSKFKPKSVILSDKLDGISCLLHWKPHKSIHPQLYTRGNGEEGTDITPLLRVMSTFTSILDKLKKITVTDRDYEFFIRGELVIPKHSWETKKTTLWADYQNPRNTVAGLIGRKLSSHKKTKDGIKALNEINFVPFTIDTKTKDGKWNLMNKADMFDWMKSNLDPKNIVWHQIMDSNKALDKSFLSQILLQRRDLSPFEIDGIIVWDNTNLFEPNTDGNPEHAFAFKMLMDDQKAETLVTDIEWNISRTGVWKPVVLFEPVNIGGTRISRSTGNNAAWIIERGIGVGARILLVRSGDVIPKIEEVISGVSSNSIPMPPDGTWKWDANKTNILASGDSTAT